MLFYYFVVVALLHTAIAHDLKCYPKKPILTGFSSSEPNFKGTVTPQCERRDPDDYRPICKEPSVTTAAKCKSESLAEGAYKYTSCECEKPRNVILEASFNQDNNVFSASATCCELAADVYIGDTYEAQSNQEATKVSCLLDPLRKIYFDYPPQRKNIGATLTCVLQVAKEDAKD